MFFSKLQFRAAQTSFRTILVLAFLVVVFGLGPIGFLSGPYNSPNVAYAAAKGDMDRDGDIDLDDLQIFSQKWLGEDWQNVNWCQWLEDEDNAKIIRRMNGLHEFIIDYFQCGQPPEPNEPPPPTEDPFAIEHTNDYPIRISWGPFGNLYVTDTKYGSVFIYDSSLTLVGELKGLNKPLGVGVDSLGNIYVGNNGTDNVEVYDPNGVKTATIGDGIIKMPNELAFDLSGNLYVVDSVDNKIKVYDPLGQNIRNIAADTPISLAISSYIDSNSQEVGELFVAEMRLARISVFDLEGNYLRSIGRKVSTFGSFWHGRFVKLQSLAIDSLGRVHALDCYLNKVQILDALDGTYLGSYPSGEEPDHTKLFLDVVLTDPNTAVLTNSENKQLETFQY
ncbi:MAG: NHL repeat-containing protein [Planctomycetota bacterium]|jgi:hypothetical protein